MWTYVPSVPLLYTVPTTVPYSRIRAVTCTLGSVFGVRSSLLSAGPYTECSKFSSQQVLTKALALHSESAADHPEWKVERGRAAVGLDSQLSDLPARIVQSCKLVELFLFRVVR